MPKRPSVGEILADDERGVLLTITAASIVLLILLFVGVAEFGRYMILKEQTQTATDAAALAASYSGVTRWVKIRVMTDRGQAEHCSTDSNGDTYCWCDP